MNDTVEHLFRQLDLEGDGELRRHELHEAARRLKWHWPESRLYAVLDRLTLDAPLSRARFTACFDRIARTGIYGEVLRGAPPPGAPVPLPPSQGPAAAEEDPAALLGRLAGAAVGADYRRLLEERGPLRLESRAAAALIIDPQRSFTGGAWMASIGADGPRQVEPIRRACGACARLVAEQGDRVERMLTRCPFPPASYDWDERVAAVVGDSHPYFVKPDNSALWPPTNGFREWVTRRGIRTLVVGGCTLNSCVRVSTIDARRSLEGLRVVASLDLCGARLDNYIRSERYGGLSSVESAVRAMEEAGVEVAARVEWAHSP